LLALVKPAEGVIDAVVLREAKLVGWWRRQLERWWRGWCVVLRRSLAGARGGELVGLEAIDHHREPALVALDGDHVVLHGGHIAFDGRQLREKLVHAGPDVRRRDVVAHRGRRKRGGQGRIAGGRNDDLRISKTLIPKRSPKRNYLFA